MISPAYSLIKHVHGLAREMPGTEVGTLSHGHVILFFGKRNTGHVLTMYPCPTEELHKSHHRSRRKAGTKKPLQYIVTSATRGFHRRLWKEWGRAFKFAGEKGGGKNFLQEVKRASLYGGSQLEQHGGEAKAVRIRS